MPDYWLLLLVVVAIGIGWLLGRREQPPTEPPREQRWNRDYFQGLNYLLNEEPDRAIDIFQCLVVNAQTIDTHLALGSMFRRRGEVERAVQAHQHLMTRPSLSRSQHEQIALELARDFMAAGLLDRAEEFLLELAETSERQRVTALRLLQSTYEQEKEWEKAIDIADKLMQLGETDVRQALAHYCCELAAGGLACEDYELSRRWLKQALQYDSRCVRVSLMQGELEYAAGRYKAALRALRRVRQQAPEYLPEAVEGLARCYEALGQAQRLKRYLAKCLEAHPSITVALKLAEEVKRQEGDAEAKELLSAYVREHHSIRGAKRLLAIELQENGANADSNLYLRLLDELAAEKPAYRCRECGFAAGSLYWLCPSCKSWGAVAPIYGLEGE